MANDRELKLPPGGELLPDGYQVFHTKEVLWRITPKCNLACPHCYANAGDAKEPEALSFEQCRSIMDSLAESAAHRGEVFCISWMGGEPLVRPDIFAIMDYARTKGFVQHMGTNGVLLTPENCARLKEVGLSLACVSLDSHIPAVHDSLKGPGVFEKAVQGIKNLKAAGVEGMTVFVMTKLNFDEMDEYERFCREELDVDCFFSLLHNIGRAQDVYGDLVLSMDQIKEIYRRKYHRIESYMRAGRLTELPIMELFDLTPFVNTPADEADLAYLSWGVGCQGCRFCLGVDYNGDVLPCERMPLTLGNLLEQRLEEIEATELFQKIIKREERGGKCGVCEHLSLCGGGCMAEAYGKTGDPFAECGYCWYEPKGVAAHAASSPLNEEV